MRKHMGLVIKTALAVDYGLRNRLSLRKALAAMYNERLIGQGKIPKVGLAEIIGAVPEIKLVNFVPEHGNVTAFELVCLCSLVRALQPKDVLEIGTFNGNTTLQIAANLELGACISTLDLPIGSSAVAGNDVHDAGLIHAASREKPRYVDSGYQDRVQQHYGNSLETTFSTLNRRSPDFVFIDAGHSYACVKNDTEKALVVLAPGGMVVWHDYTQDWPDVYAYLNELTVQWPLKHIDGTNLVTLRKPH